MKFDKMIKEQLAKNVTVTSKLTPEMSDASILRLAIQAEYDAVNLYEQMAATTDNTKLKETFLEVANEEKVHIGEFETLLSEIDDDHKKEKMKGKEEVKK